jgi:hypothetical protein
MSTITLEEHPPYDRYYQKKCAYCGIVFFSKSPRAKYFPNKCRQNAYRERKEQRQKTIIKVNTLLKRKTPYNDTKNYWAKFKTLSLLELNFGFQKILGVTSKMLKQNLKKNGDEILLRDNTIRIMLIKNKKYQIDVLKRNFL